MSQDQEIPQLSPQIDTTEKKVRVYDVEALYDFFCVTFRDRYSEEKHYFEISALQNDLTGLVEFMENKIEGLVGYNNINYDWPVLNYVYLTRRKFAKMRGEEIAREISTFSQRIISQKYSSVRNAFIPQLDLFKVHHFDNKNKAVSLKALQIAMNWPLVADMPMEHTEYVDTQEKARKVAEYNDNDVLSTKYFLELSEKDIALRKRMSELYNMDLLNHNEPKMGEDIILTEVAKAMGVSFFSIKQTNTKRDSVALADCMLPISFDSPEFRRAQAKFASTVVDTRIRSEEEQKAPAIRDLFSCIFDGAEYNFGLGGLHGLRAPGVYEESGDKMILSADVSSYYIHLAIQNGFKPEHLGQAFATAFNGVYVERKKWPKLSLEDKGLKKGLVSVSGKSISQYSAFYDPKYFFQIMVNGQLLLSKLCEMVTSGGGKVIMANTDGIEVIVDRDKEPVMQRIFEAWMKDTRLILEYKQYKRLFIRDVNNYIGEMPGGKTYVKGAYEWEDKERPLNSLEWHKDHSMLCVPYAAEKFLIKGQSIRQSFDECPVEMFFIGKRAKSGGRFEMRSVLPEAFLAENESPIITQYYSRTIRYLIGKEGGYLFKKEESSKNASKIDAPWKVIDCMDLRGVELETLRPRIDYRYYEQEVKRLLSPILDRQHELF